MMYAHYSVLDGDNHAKRQLKYKNDSRMQHQSPITTPSDFNHLIPNEHKL